MDLHVLIASFPASTAARRCRTHSFLVTPSISFICLPISICRTLARSRFSPNGRLRVNLLSKSRCSISQSVYWRILELARTPCLSAYPSEWIGEGGERRVGGLENSNPLVSMHPRTVFVSRVVWIWAIIVVIFNFGVDDRPFGVGVRVKSFADPDSRESMEGAFNTGLTASSAVLRDTSRGRTRRSSWRCSLYSNRPTNRPGFAIFESGSITVCSLHFSQAQRTRPVDRALFLD